MGVAIFVFMMTCVVALLLGLCVLAYAMHCLLVVVQDTAAGGDEVIWPAEPFLDAIGGAFHLTAVVLIWLAPVGILSRALRDVWLPDDAALRFMLLALPGLWLFLPVAFLSSLSASSRWFIFRPVVVWNLLRLAPFTFVVYLISAILGEIVTALAFYTVVRGWIILVPATALTTAAALLLYGRLLGRLGWKMSRLSVNKPHLVKKARPPTVAPRISERPAPIQPLGPEELDPQWETTPYGQKRRRAEGYGLAPQDAAPTNEETPERITVLKLPPKEAVTDEPPPDFDRKIRGRIKRFARPPRSFLSGVLPFPWYRQTRVPLLVLSLGFMLLYGFAYVIFSFYSAIYKGG